MTFQSSIYMQGFSRMNALNFGGKNKKQNDGQIHSDFSFKPSTFRLNSRRVASTMLSVSECILPWVKLILSKSTSALFLLSLKKDRILKKFDSDPPLALTHWVSNSCGKPVDLLPRPTAVLQSVWRPKLLFCSTLVSLYRTRGLFKILPTRGSNSRPTFPLFSLSIFIFRSVNVVLILVVLLSKCFRRLSASNVTPPPPPTCAGFKQLNTQVCQLKEKNSSNGFNFFKS